MTANGLGDPSPMRADAADEVIGRVNEGAGLLVGCWASQPVGQARAGIVVAAERPGPAVASSGLGEVLVCGGVGQEVDAGRQQVVVGIRQQTADPRW